MDLKEVDILGSDIATHWYYRSKANAMKHLINALKPSKVLDIGAGSGFFARQILAHTSAQEAWCVDIGYNCDSESEEAGKPVHFIRTLESVEADLVLIMDVLEHVDNDVELLKDYVMKVPSGSKFLISVPAFQFLWSAHDDFLDHKRRYTLPQLEDTVAASGLRVKHGSYYFGMVFPIAVATRFANKLRRDKKEPAKSQLRRHHPFVNNTLATLCRFELTFMKLNRLAGLTAFCLAEKV